MWGLGGGEEAVVVVFCSSRLLLVSSCRKGTKVKDKLRRELYKDNKAGYRIVRGYVEVGCTR